MLVLTRKSQEKILMRVPTEKGIVKITVFVCGIYDGHIRLGIDAPQQVNIVRSELEKDAQV